MEGKSTNQPISGVKRSRDGETAVPQLKCVRFMHDTQDQKVYEAAHQGHIDCLLYAMNSWAEMDKQMQKYS